MVLFAPGTTYVLPSTSWLVRERVDSDDPVADHDAPDPADPAPPVDPFDDADALEELGCEIATLAAHIHAATARLLEMLADFDRRRGWELGGHRSCAHWLSARTGIDLGAAREKVRTARVLVGLPGTVASMGRGELSFSKVRALTRVATAENEADLLELARGCTTAQLERMVRAWKKGSREDEAVRERERWRSRRFSVFPDDEGMYVVKGRLPAEVGALLMRAVEAASDALYREEGRRVAAGVPFPAEESRRAAARRRADAVGLLAERALGVGFGAAGPGAGGCAGDGEGGAAPDGGEAHVPPPPASEAPVSGTRAERYQVMLHVEPATLAATGEPGRSELGDGTRVSAETSRRLACDAAVVRITQAPLEAGRPDGGDPGPASAAPDRSPDRAPPASPRPLGAPAPDPTRRSTLSVGRRTRTIPPALRRALEVRDRGCRFPGCGLRFTDAHHVKHWADGGETSLLNTLLLCRHHHRLVHEEGWQVDWWGEGRPVFFDPRGGAHYDGRWEPPEGWEGRVEALLEQNGRRGATPDGWTASARWTRELDIPDDVLFAALEAMG